MARPQSVSDDQILEAARAVISRSGYDGFTLSEVAEEIGLSRAAIILRFQSTHALKVRILSGGIQKFITLLEELPVTRSGDGLLLLADFLGSLTTNPDHVAHFFTILRGNIRDEELAALEKQRGNAWHDAIVKRMPKTKISAHDAAELFSAMLIGAITQWETNPETSSVDLLCKRTKDWLTLANIEFTDDPTRYRKAKQSV